MHTDQTTTPTPGGVSLLRRSDTVPVRLVVWAQQPADYDQAIEHALQGWGRRTWALMVVERSTDETCPIDLGNPDAIATHRQGGWAYAAFRADR